MDASSHTRRLASRVLAHGTYAKGVSDGELVARRSARLVQECCTPTNHILSSPPAEPLALIFQDVPSRSLKTLYLRLIGSGTINNGITNITFSNLYENTIEYNSTVSIYSNDLTSVTYHYNQETYYTLTCYSLPHCQSIQLDDDRLFNHLTDLVFTQIAPSLETIEHIYPQPLELTSLDLINVPHLKQLQMSGSSGKLASITNMPSTLLQLIIPGNNFSGVFTLPTANLDIFVCSSNPITSLANIPTSLQYLYIDGTAISGTYTLSSTPILQYFDADNTHISVLQAIPSTIKSIRINNTDISGSFDLVGYPLLEAFECDNSGINQLLNTPTSIKTMSISNTSISGAFDLSGLSQLYDFRCIHTHITDIQNIPSSMMNLYISQTDISGVLNLSGLSSLMELSTASTNITNIINIPNRIVLMSCIFMNLTQLAAETIASNITASGATGGSLSIILQGSLPEIDITTAPFLALIANGWNVA